MLASCLYCGTQISSSATVCPECKVDTPLGLQCVFCQQHGRRDQVVQVSGAGYTHEACLARYFSLPEGFSCPECQSVLVGKNTRRPTVREMASACPKCGYPSLLTTSGCRCCDCGFPFYKALGQKRVMISSGHPGGMHSDGIPGTWSHTFCRSAQGRSKVFTREQTITLYASILVGSAIGLAIWPIAPTWLRVVLCILAFPVALFMFFSIVGLLCWLEEDKNEEEA